MQATNATEQNALEQALNHIRPEVRREHAYLVGMPEGITVKLNQNESPFDLPSALKEEVARAVQEIAFNRYPEEHPYRLRDALAERLDHDPDGILIGNGSNEMVHTLGLTMIDPGTPVVLPTPMFSLYAKVIRLHAGRLISVPPLPDLRFDADGLVEAVEEEDPALVVLTTPNNPTGLAMDIDEVRRILEVAPGLVVVDEAYVEFVDGPNASTLLADFPNLIIMRTFSKAAGLAGLRLGYMVGHPAIMKELLKARLPFMVDRVAEQSALVLLRYPEVLAQQVDRIRNSITTLTETLQTIPEVEVTPSQANFVIFSTPVEPAVISNRLRHAGILVRDMSGYPELQGYLRVNAGTEHENNAFLTALKRSLT